MQGGLYRSVDFEAPLCGVAELYEIILSDGSNIKSSSLTHLLPPPSEKTPEANPSIY